MSQNREFDRDEVRRDRAAEKCSSGNRAEIGLRLFLGGPLIAVHRSRPTLSLAVRSQTTLTTSRGFDVDVAASPAEPGRPGEKC
jgi:hypothetical protein